MIDPYLQNLKDKFISDLKELLQNKAKKSAKRLQQDSENLYNKFTKDISNYRKTKVAEIEKKVAETESKALLELDNQLNQL